jgi:hypothetical protein
VTGELSIRDHVRSLELTAKLEDADPTGATLSTEAELNLATWGIDSKMGMINKTARVEGRLRFTRPTSAAVLDRGKGTDEHYRPG